MGFPEDTIDGRRTKTTATRTGNLLVLDQKGDQTKGEKDSVMTREVKGDVMTMKLIVDDIKCIRIYKRMQDINENIVDTNADHVINNQENGDGNESIVKDTENMIHSQVISTDKTEILESISLPENDTFPGKYLMESSDKFDEYMKALGVGMIKRRLANSVVPINEIEISESGLYTIRTLTTVRNTELTFHLNEPFTEDTIDGRKTETTATRTGNLLVLDQKADASKGEKNTVMTREVDGDLMTTKLIVDNITCIRIYKRMQE